MNQLGSQVDCILHRYTQERNVLVKLRKHSIGRLYQQESLLMVEQYNYSKALVVQVHFSSHSALLQQFK